MTISETDPVGPKKQSAKGFWSEMLQTMAVALVIAMVFRSLFYVPFHIPSGSMRMTLLEGDYIFVNKMAYGYSRYSFPFGARIPYFSGRILAGEPERGDVIVFRKPNDPTTDYIKRLIGLPGDKVQVNGGVVYINDRAVPRYKAEEAVSVDNMGVHRRIPQYVEELPNGRMYQVLDDTQLGEVDFTEPYRVPEGHYFFMGDNRDHSADSRYLNDVGFVPFENLIGRAEIIFFSTDGSAHIWEIWKWASTLRIDRFFRSIP